MSGLDLLALGLDFMGGLMGKKSEDRQNRLQMQEARNQFNAQMDQSVQRRVKDATKAGVHPLFALGASVGASPTISAQGEQRGDPRAAALGQMAATLNSLETNKAQAARDHAQAALFDSERKRIEQSLNAEGQDATALRKSGVRTIPLPASSGPYTGPLEVIPSQQIAAKPYDRGVEGGDHPLRRDYVDDTGQVIRGFSSESQMDEISQGKIAAAKARWMSEWKIYEMSRGRGKRAYQAKRWLRNNTHPSYWRKVHRQLRQIANESPYQGRKRRKPVFRLYKQKKPSGGAW